MKSHATIRRFLIRSIVALAASAACVLAFVSWAGAAHDSVVMSVAADAPLRVTLMPNVVVSASVSRPGRVTMQVSDEAPLSVTLLPTVNIATRQ